MVDLIELHNYSKRFQYMNFSQIMTQPTSTFIERTDNIGSLVVAHNLVLEPPRNHSSSRASYCSWRR